MTVTPAKWPRKLRSQEWFGGNGKDAIYHRGRMKNQGYPVDLFDSRPVVGICNPFAMDVVKALRSKPIDGVVLLAGCDKTAPALLMGAASVDLPANVVSGRPMLNGHFRGERVRSGTHIRKFNEAVKADEMTPEEFVEAEQSLSRSQGGCSTMGTASTIASTAEALGMALPGNAAIPAVDCRRRAISQQTGRRIVQMVKVDLKPSDILTKKAVENAIRTNGAIIKPSAALPDLMTRRDCVIVFENIEDEKTRADWDDLDIGETPTMSLKYSGPKGCMGMAEYGNMPMPAKRLKAGVRDKVDISDDRMLGTAYGTEVLRTGPRAVVSGPMAVVQASADFDFLAGRRGTDIARESHR